MRSAWHMQCRFVCSMICAERLLPYSKVSLVPVCFCRYLMKLVVESGHSVRFATVGLSFPCGGTSLSTTAERACWQHKPAKEELFRAIASR